MRFELELLGKICEILREIDREEIFKKLKEAGVPSSRLNLVENILIGRQEVGFFSRLDIFIYVLKIVDPCSYRMLDAMSHAKSNGCLYEYDPAKNGQNIIKHGVSFTEVVSYSERFGRLLVSCPEVNNETRVVILSDLSLSQSKGLSLPLESTLGSRVCTMSVAQRLEGKFRFISARIISDNRLHKKMRNALKGIYSSDLLDRCVEIVRNDLFDKGQVSA